jgi:diacylglycerol kinase
MRSFQHALEGFRLLVSTQHNFRIHLAATVAVCIFGVVLALNAQEWLWIVLCVAMVLATEAANTAIENLGNAITLERNEHVGRAKDVAAAMVLIASVAAAVIGLAILLPKLWIRLSIFLANP